jgi:hypothetical protein
MGDFENDHFSLQLLCLSSLSFLLTTRVVRSSATTALVGWIFSIFLDMSIAPANISGKLYAYEYVGSRVVRILFRTVVNIKVRLYNSQNIPSRGK